jgi:hypothetical protein
VITRRRWLCTGLLLPLVGVAGLAPRRARAATLVQVPNVALGAIVAATGGELLDIEIDPNLADDQIAVAGGTPLPVGHRVLRKGEGAAASRFLDDARNATKLGRNIKTALSSVLPELAAELDANHDAWAKPFAKQALAWTKQLAALELGSVRDEHGRIYLLEWAGATIDPNGRQLDALAQAPEQPSDPTLAAYTDYVAALVRGVST